MLSFFRAIFIATAALWLTACGEDAEGPKAPPAGDNIEAFTRGMEAHAGYVPFYLDRLNGKLYLALDEFDRELIYLYSLPQGVGSNDLGFDRGQQMSTEPALVRFDPVGDKVLLHRINTRYRADSDSATERQSVTEAFASSVLWGFPVVARDENAVLVDATDFLLRDSHGIGRKLREQQQGEYAVDASRSALYYPRIKGFVRNTELEATITFTGEKPGDFLASVTPDAHSFTVRMHHSFIALPEPGYQPRAFRPDSGYWLFSYEDYAAPLGEDQTQRLIPRHRLQKKKPGAAESEAIDPIVYYLDPGTPEPVRSALLDGARWWNEAFEAAGYRDAFQVEMLPEGADPMDVRYNVIQWVHRATRGWSYGYGVHDPRNGEIIKGHVTLGSLRVRQDYLIAQGMTSPFDDDNADTAPLSEMALARIRQLSAHEIGHTLGLAHNFAASARDRESVMDYPHPLLHLEEDGSISLEGAYATGIGAWDKRAIQYGYGNFGDPAAENPALDAFLAENRALGFDFISDPDSRAIETLHATSSLWDNGSDAVAELQRVMAVRKAALAQFGAASIPYGEPWSSLEEVLVPVYYYHRYQVEAAGKWLGGADYRYALREPGDEFKVNEVSAENQARALAVLLATLDPEFLRLPEGLIEQIPPKAYGYERSRESSSGFTGLTLDPVSLAEASVQHTLNVLLHPQRLARMTVQAAGDNQQVSADEVFDALFEQVVQGSATGELAALQLRAGGAVLAHWRHLARDTTVAPEVRAKAWSALQRSRDWMLAQQEAPRDYAEFYGYQSWLIEQLAVDEAAEQAAPPRALPPGSPIG